jgi:hypothetical protein
VRKASALIQNAAVTPMRYVYPLDPECPVVAEFMETLFGDPTTMAMGAPVEDITEEFECRHRKQCPGFWSPNRRAKGVESQPPPSAEASRGGCTGSDLEKNSTEKTFFFPSFSNKDCEDAHYLSSHTRSRDFPMAKHTKHRFLHSQRRSCSHPL